jgi:mersacidin/lichenicidin family type 2 lantibiotic
MDTIRAWKDEEYRMSLTEEQRSLLPDNPAGLVELSDAELESIAGGGGPDNTANVNVSACQQNTACVNVTACQIKLSIALKCK